MATETGKLEGRLAIVSLGCPKNQVDSEYIAGQLQEAGLELTEVQSEANYIVINTCGFIESAIREAIDAILKAGAERGNGHLRNIIVCGCVAQRFTQEIAETLPEVDAIVGAKSYYRIAEVIRDLDKQRWREEGGSEERAGAVAEATLRSKGRAETDALRGAYREKKHETLVYKSCEAADAIAHMKGKRLVSSKHYAYLKIAEGCAHNCTYCAIPSIRGPHISRPAEELLSEAHNLMEAGFREIILVAQDLSYYGQDLYGERRLNSLLRDLLRFPELKFLRCLYLYPEALNEDFIRLMRENRRLCAYVDLPIQHASDRILKRMGRKETQEELRRRIRSLREAVPDVSLRTTVMVGFPSENETDFDELLHFIEEQRFDHLGCFIYSPEEGTAAAKMSGRVPAEIAEDRYNRVMELQQRISRENLARRIGRIEEVLIEEVSDDGLFYIGRSAAQAPDIDSRTYILSERAEVKLGEFYDVEIVDSDDYSLTGVLRDEHGK